MFLKVHVPIWLLKMLTLCALCRIVMALSAIIHSFFCHQIKFSFFIFCRRWVWRWLATFLQSHCKAVDTYNIILECVAVEFKKFKMLNVLVTFFSRTIIIYPLMWWLASQTKRLHEIPRCLCPLSPAPIVLKGDNQHCVSIQTSL